MFTVRDKTARALFAAQEPGLRKRLRLDLSPSYRAADLRGDLDVPVAVHAIGERTLQVMGGFADDRVVADPKAAFVVLMPGPDDFAAELVTRLGRNLGLPRRGTEPALRLLGEDFAEWAGRVPAEAEAYAVVVENHPHFRIVMRCEPFAPVLAWTGRPVSPVAGVAPSRLGRP